MENSTFTQEMYETHHHDCRSEGFSILKDERGSLFRRIIGTGKDVLDIGCRDGSLTVQFLEGNRVSGVDIDAQVLERAKALGITTTQMDLHGNWKELAGKTFDVVVAGETLEHLFYPEQVVKKVRAHIREGGVFVGSVPNAFSLKNRLRLLCGTKKGTPLEDPTHINQFKASELCALLSQHFRSVEVRGLGRYTRLAAFSPGWFAFDLVFIATV